MSRASAGVKPKKPASNRSTPVIMAVAGTNMGCASMAAGHPFARRVCLSRKRTASYPSRRLVHKSSSVEALQNVPAMPTTAMACS